MWPHFPYLSHALSTGHPSMWGVAYMMMLGGLNDPSSSHFPRYHSLINGNRSDTLGVGNETASLKSMSRATQELFYWVYHSYWSRPN